MAFENAGSIVQDLREALQDVVAPDLKAVVRGLADVKESVASLRTEIKEGNALLREEIGRVEVRTAERMEQSEERTRERIDRVYDAIKIADLTRRNEELLRENQQLKRPQPEQQH